MRTSSIYGPKFDASCLTKDNANSMIDVKHFLSFTYKSCVHVSITANAHWEFIFQPISVREQPCFLLVNIAKINKLKGFFDFFFIILSAPIQVLRTGLQWSF